MLSYNHIYHAGCAADVFKHTVLSLVIKHLNLKGKPYTIIDTHAGRGIYDLSDECAKKTGEADYGIKRLLKYTAAHDAPASIKQYIDIVQSHSFYSASPAIAFFMMRPLDTLILCELHPNEIALLRRNMKDLSAALCPSNGNKYPACPAAPAVAIHFRDAFEAAIALTPPKTRGLLFMDPSYEDTWEYKKVSDTLKAVSHKWPQGIIALWYPVLDKRNSERSAMLSSLKSLLPPEKVFDYVFMAEHEGLAMKGSGMLILNPPYKLEEEVKEAAAYIAEGIGSRE